MNMFFRQKKDRDRETERKSAMLDSHYTNWKHQTDEKLSLKSEQNLNTIITFQR